MNPVLVSLSFFFLIGAAGFGFYMAVFGTNRAVEERFADIAVKMRVAQGALEDETEQRNLARLVVKWASKRLPAPDPRTPAGEKLSQTLVQAGFMRSGAAQIYQVIRVAAIITGVLLGLAISIFLGAHGGRVLLVVFLGAALGLFLPSYYLNSRARKRQNAIARQLSDILDLLVVCVEAGLGLYEAIKIVGVEAERQKQEIGTELSMVATEISAGSTLGQSLKNLAERTAVEDIKPLAATLIQSEQLGAQIAPALNASSDALRTRRRLRAEESAQKASIKILFPLVLFVLPAMIAVIVGPAMINVVRTLKGG